MGAVDRLPVRSDFVQRAQCDNGHPLDVAFHSDGNRGIAILLDGEIVLLAPAPKQPL